MRLMGPDVVLFVVGAFLFGGSLYGLYQSGGLGEGATSAFGAFTLTWSEEEQTVDGGAFGTGPSAPIAFSVVEDAVTTVDVVVDCRHTVAAPGVTTTVAVTVTSPAGETQTAEGACGAPVTVTFDFGPAPEGGVVQAENANEAAAAAEADVGQAAKGDWSGEVTFSQSSTGGVGLPIQVEFAGSTTGVLTTWSATAAPVTR